MCVLPAGWSCRHGPITRQSRTTIQPSPQSQLVSSTMLPGRWRRSGGTSTSSGPNLNHPASRSSIAPKTLGPSIVGRHIHSTAPLGATSAVTSQSDKNA